MPTKTWKSRERSVAGDFGVGRTPLSGGNSGHTRSDTLHSELFIEHKHRKSHAVVALYDNTRELAKKEGKIPVVTLSQHGRHGYLIVIDPKDLKRVAELYGGD
jgi:hypothetical protein